MNSSCASPSTPACSSRVFPVLFSMSFVRVVPVFFRRVLETPPRRVLPHAFRRQWRRLPPPHPRDRLLSASCNSSISAGSTNGSATASTASARSSASACASSCLASASCSASEETSSSESPELFGAMASVNHRRTRRGIQFVQVTRNFHLGVRGRQRHIPARRRMTSATLKPAAGASCTSGISANGVANSEPGSPADNSSSVKCP